MLTGNTYMIKIFRLRIRQRRRWDGLLPPAEGRLKLSEIKERIYQCLEENLAYDESAVTLNGNNDFLAYTLEQKKKGYSVHYATAAVLMLRYYGVPARYVEGYYLRPEEANAAHREKNWCWMRPMRMRGQSIIWTYRMDSL